MKVSSITTTFLIGVLPFIAPALALPQAEGNLAVRQAEGNLAVRQADNGDPEACKRAKADCGKALANCAYQCRIKKDFNGCVRCIQGQGVKQQACFDDLKKCLGKTNPGLVDIDCAADGQRCVGQIGSDGNGGDPGLCTPKGFAGSVDNGGGICSGGNDCDTSVTGTPGCGVDIEQ